ncbi:hypothetical protein [Raineyella fluvialis]|uniref:Rho termination factor, N-terminal domain n=1 Tax=Raineyella fluvialis TaxID=2662261 RepID=A0A5Q2FC75_9ACTN|nr:hypothetical protein [Raineyella fluvialis]QGF23024.1 hypothetical protein Rai3103_04365 [Raineyella fluvialis]
MTETSQLTDPDRSTVTDDVGAAAEALRALAAAEGGDVLAGQLSRLVAVIAQEAIRTKRFRSDLVAAVVPEPAPSAPNAAPGAGSGSASPVTRSRLERMTKPDLKRLIDQEGMDPDRTLRSKATKPAMIDLILAFRATGSGAPTANATPVAAPEAASPAKPPKRRRRPSPLNPYAVAAEDGAEGLREQLQQLDVEELKDIVTEYGMNHDRRAMSWTDHDRFVERILAKTDFGASQGSAFRSS